MHKNNQSQCWIFAALNSISRKITQQKLLLRLELRCHYAIRVRKYPVHPLPACLQMTLLKNIEPIQPTRCRSCGFKFGSGCLHVQMVHWLHSKKIIFPQSSAFRFCHRKTWASRGRLVEKLTAKILGRHILRRDACSEKRWWWRCAHSKRRRNQCYRFRSRSWL